MRRHAMPLALLAFVALASCGAPTEEAAPVATPSVSVAAPTGTAGHEIDVSYRFEVPADAPPFTLDYTVFVHLRDDRGRLIGGGDHAPSPPTSAWRPGATIEYMRPLFVPRVPPGPVQIEVGLYDTDSLVRLPLDGPPAGDERAILAASFHIAEDPRPVTFGAGWHEPETPPGTSGVWRWSAKAGELLIPRLEGEAELVLLVDQPGGEFPVPQQVEVRLGGAVVETFELRRGASVLRRIALPWAEGEASESLVATLVVDKTFVPAELPGYDSADDRQLGLRLFHVYVEPKQEETGLN